MRMSAKELKLRLESLKTERSNINMDWEEIGRLVVPGRGRMYETTDNENSITRDYPEKYDSTAVVSAQSLAAALHSGLTSPATDWFGLRFKTQALNDDIVASAWLQACQEKIFDTIQESNFNLEVNEMYLDVVSFGTSIILHEYDDGEFRFRSAFPREMYFEEDFNGKLIGVYREKQYTAQQLMLKFPSKCPSEIVEQANSPANANQKYTVIHIVRLNPDNKESAEGATILPADKRPYEERYVLHKDATELTEEPAGYYEMPGYVIRWGRMSGSKFGFSPALNALPDIRTVNTLVSQILDAGAKVIDPALLTVQRGIIGDIDLAPGGETVVRDLDSMRPFESGARFDVSQLLKTDLVASIRQAFYVDQLELPQNDRMTATEVQVRYEQMQRLLGPALFRIQADFLNPLIERSFKILHREGQLPDMPTIVEEAEEEFEIEYLGPLARSQKMNSVNAFQQLMTVLERVAAVKPEVIESINWNDAVQDMALRMGVPAKYLKSDEEMEKEQGARAQAEQEQQQMAKGESLASAMKDGAAAMKLSTEAQVGEGGVM